MLHSACPGSVGNGQVQRLARVERVAGLRLDEEDLLALELAIMLVRLDDARRRAGA